MLTQIRRFNNNNNNNNSFYFLSFSLLKILLIFKLTSSRLKCDIKINKSYLV